MKDNNFIYKCLILDSFSIELNANDLFNYACADSVRLDCDDYDWAIPIMEEFGYDGTNAVMSYIRNCDVIPHRKNDNFVKAYNKIKELNPKVESRD